MEKWDLEKWDMMRDETRRMIAGNKTEDDGMMAE